MKIQLVQASSESKGLANEKWPIPLNLIALGTYLENSGYEVEILDGTHHELNNILERIDGDVVGIGFNIFSTQEMDRISECAKDRGSLVVVGGQAATPLAKQLLANNRNIDVVVRYDGEEALRQIADRVSSNDFSGIPNTVYRRDGEIIEERIEELDIEKLPIPNRRIINMEQYITSWDGDPSIRPTNTYTKRGCDRACSFCARIHKGIRTRTPEQVFEEDKKLVEEFGVNYIFEMADTYFTDMNWLKRLREVYEYNGGLPAKYWVFCSLDDINPETVEIMKDLNVDTVCVGIESGSEEIRKNNGKNFTNKEIFEAAKRLGRTGIKLVDSYIIGLIGESEETVKETYLLSKKVAELCEVRNRGYSLILPLPGSPIWKRMMRIPELQAKYGHKYSFDTEELRRDYISHFCNL